jgi:hypothetical protein
VAEAAPDVVTEVGPDAEPDVGAEAAPDAEPDVVAEAEPDAEPACTEDDFRCDGLQPQQCVGGLWTAYGGECRYECSQGPGITARCITTPTLSDLDCTAILSPEFLGLADPYDEYHIKFTQDTSTNLDWRWTPILKFYSANNPNSYFQGTYTQAGEFCFEVDFYAPSHGGWWMPTQSQLHDVTPQEYPIDGTIHPRLMNDLLFCGEQAPWPIPNCYWTSTPGSTSGTHVALWGPNGLFQDTSDSTTCAAWCIR